ncbi:MAG TPA: hypothetical protein VGE04_10400, partial [Chloroflexia bacterium]
MHSSAIPFPTPTIDPAVTERGLDITKDEFNTALARWRARNIREYEMVVEYSAYTDIMGRWTLRVRTDGVTGEVISYAQHADGPEPPTGGS